jgi:predicted phage tail protein
MRSVSSVGARILQILAAFFIGTISSHAASVTLAWDQNPEPDIAGYRVLYGTSSGVYAQALDVGNTTTAVVPNLTAGTTYYFAVRAYNTAAIDGAASAEISFTLPSPNTPPTVALTGPTNGSTYMSPAGITLSATASDSDGTVARVEFYQGTTKLGEDSASPYAFTWNGVAPGTYSLVARAIDNAGAQTNSATVTVTVNAPNQSPTVAISSPANDSLFTSPANIAINATAADADGSVARVEFYRDTTKLGEDTSSPYTFTWNAAPAGAYALTVRAIDNEGAATTSGTVNVTVNAPPTVALSTNGTSFTAPASITLTAAPADSDGTIARVDFFSGTTRLGERTAGPFTFTWSGVGTGNYALTAVAVDNRGAVASSAAINVTVSTGNQPPTVAITSPTSGSMHTAPAAITISSTATDSDGSVARVDFYAGATKIGTSTTSPYSYTWSNVASGAYALTAVAVDNAGASTTSAQVSVTVNASPTVTIQTNGTTFTEPASITITATPADTDGTISRVEFFNGVTKLGEKTASPFTFTWTNAPAGSHTLSARAFDNRGASGTSPTVDVTVNGPNQSPTVAITSPANGSTFVAPASLTITATASDPDGAVARVEFYRGTTKLGEDTSSPYSFAWNSAPAGTYSLTAVAVDDAGGATTSTPVSITITAPNSSPTVAITSPANGGTFTAPASILINATAADSDGTIARVDFYQGTTKLGQDTTSPYSYSWGSVAAGSYTLTAVAVDSAGNTATSAPVSITVQGRNVVLTTNGTSFTPGATISLSASTAQLSGRVRRVEFYRDSILLFKDTKYAYAYSWKGVPAGTYVLKAKAVMLSGVTYTSAPVTVVVGASQPSAMMAVSSSYEDPMPTVTPYRQQDGTFNLGITGQTGQTYKVWVSADLENWTLMTTVTNDIGFISVTDPDAPNHKQRFYRVSVQE